MNGQICIPSNTQKTIGDRAPKGTNLPVDSLMRLYALGWTRQQVLNSYPHLTPEALKTVFDMAANWMRDEDLHTLSLSKAIG